MNLKNTVLSEKARSKRSHIVWYHLSEICRIGKSIEAAHWCFPGAGENGNRNNWLSGSEISFCNDGNVLELDRDSAFTNCECQLNATKVLHFILYEPHHNNKKNPIFLECKQSPNKAKQRAANTIRAGESRSQRRKLDFWYHISSWDIKLCKLNKASRRLLGGIE